MAKKIVADGARISTVSVGKERNTLPVAPDMKVGDALSASVPKTRYRSKDIEDKIPEDTGLVVAAAEQTAPDSAFAAAEQPPLLAQSDALAHGSEPDKTRQADAGSSGGNAGWWWMGAGVVAAGAGIGVGISGGGSGSNSGGTTTITGTVTDGPVQGAKLYVDVNGNGRYDEGTDTAVLDANGNQVVTDASGNFSFTVTASGAGIKLVSNGGIDTVTGEAVTLDFSAPAGYNQINPITSAIAAYMEENPGITAAQAEIAVESALGMPDLDYSSVNLADPPAGLAAADILAAQQAVAILATAAIIIAQSGTDTDAFQYIAEHLGVSGSTSALVTAVQNADPSSAAQLADTVAAIEAATDLDTIGAALNNNFFADVVTTGILSVGQTVNGDIGLGNTTGLDVAYQWQSSADGSSWTDIPGATGNSYLLTQGETGEHIRLEAVYTDTAGVAQTAYSSDMGVVPALNAAPELGDYTVTLAENSANGAAVQTVAATDIDGDALSYSITAGNASGAFEINAATGAIIVADVSKLNFETTPNFSLTVQASDGTATDTGTIAVNLSNVNEAPVITSNAGATAALSAAENQTAVTTVTSTDVDAGDGKTFSLTGGADQELFSINGTTGALTFLSAPNYEAAADAGANNGYDVQVTITDTAGLTDVQDLAVTVTNANEAPVITSNAGGATAALSATENQTAVTTVTSTDADAGDGKTFSLSGGADRALFAINATTGALTFQSAPNFEAPADAGANNVYDVQVTVTDTAGLTDVQDLAVTVTSVNEAPVITSNAGGATAALSVAENQTAVTTVTSTDADADDGKTFSLSGGADQALFTINAATGALTFQSAPNFEAPADAGANNVYDVQVTVTDTAGLTDVQDLAVTVTNANEAPVITSNAGGAAAAVGAAENQTAVTTVTSSEVDAGDGKTFSLSGGADQALFAINAITGALAFQSAPNFEAPADAGANNVYDVQVTVTDTAGLTDVQDLAVAVTNANEAPVITSNAGGATAALNAAENQTAVTTVTSTDADAGDGKTFSLSGGADQALFTINATTGALTFQSAPNFEAPADAGADNVYDVQVTITDTAGLTDVQDLAVTVTNANEAPVITSNAGGATASLSATENQTAVTTVTSTDADAGDGKTFSLSGGADQALFTINAATGALTFQSAPNFEAPADAGADNVYDVQVTTTDTAGLTDVQDLAVMVTSVNEAPVITSNAGGATAAVSVAENQTAVTTVTSTDADAGDGKTFSLSGGADQALFAINATTGALTFQSAPNFEAPADAGANNVYAVQVTVTDTAGLTDVQDLAVTVTNVNDNPVSAISDSSVAANAVAENAANGTVVGITALATDGDAGATISYSLSNNAGGRFAIDPTSGIITVANGTLLNYEIATSHNVTVLATSSDGSTNSQSFTINLTNVNEPVSAITDSDVAANSVAENAANGTEVAITALATDADAGATTSYSFSDNAGGRFAIDASSGIIAVADGTLLDYETATSHDVTVLATSSDGSTNSQLFTINLSNVGDNPVSAISDSNLAANSVVENAANGTAVGIAALAADGDSGTTISYSFSDNAGGRFAIDASSGIITVADGTLLDYETATSHDVTVLATSSDGSANSQVFTITLTGVNDNNPVFTTAITADVAENSTAVLTVAATDADIPGQTVTFSITGGADQAKFTIDASTGALSFVTAPDFEASTDVGSNNSYEVQITAADDNGGSAVQTIIATVTDVNDAPVFVPATPGTAVESAANGTTVGIIALATDPDAGATITDYSLSDNAGGRFAIDATSGVITVLDGSLLDYESAISYDVTVLATSSDGSTSSQVYTINLHNVNEGDPTISPVSDSNATANEVAENAAISTLVGITALATDAGGTISYSLSDNAGGRFAIDATSGIITVVDGNQLDYESATSHNVTVLASSTDGSTNSQVFTINLSGVNDNSPVFSSSTTATINENSTAVITVAATDADLPAQTVTFSISGGADQGKFTIDASTGALSFITAPVFQSPTDVGADNIYDVEVTADDGNGRSTAQDIAVTVIDTTPPHLISSVFEDIGGTGTLDAGDKLHLTFDEIVNIDTTGIYMAAFGSGATLTAVAPDGNGFSSKWDLTFGSDMAIAPNALNLSGAVSDTSGNVNDNLAVPFHAPVQVVVDSNGAYIDANHDGLKDAGEALADFGFGGNADLGRLAVQVAFTEVPTTALDLTGFNHDDRIIINIDSLNMPGAGITNPSNNYNSSSVSVSSGSSNLSAYVKDSMPHALQLYGRSFTTGTGHLTSDSTRILADFGTADLLANSRFIHQVAFVDNTGHVNVVVDAIGDAYIDADDNGLVDAGETVLADLGFFGAESLAHHSVDITFTAPVANPLDLGGFGADDRIHINLDSPGFAGFAGIGAQGISDVSYSQSGSRLSISGNSASLSVDITSSGNMYLKGRMFLGSSVNSTVPLARFNSSMIDGLGSIIQRVDFVGNVALVPHELGTPAVQGVRVAVDANGAWIDDNNDGRVNDSDTNADFTAGGNADLFNNAVDITVSGFPGILDLSGFNADDRIHINLNGSGLLALMSTAGVTTVDAGNINLWVTAASQRSGLSALHLSATSWQTTQAVYVSAGSSGLRFGAWGSSFSFQRLATFGTENVIDGSGNLMQQVDFVRLPIPQQNVVIESDGNWLDTNADGVHDSVNETTAADFSLGGNADLGAYAVNIHFNDLPVGPIDLSGFDSNDRIEIDVTAMGNNITISDITLLSNQGTNTMGGQTQFHVSVSGVSSGSTAIYLSSSSLKFGHKATTTFTPSITPVFNTYYTALGTLEGVLAINAGAIANNYQQVAFVIPPGVPD